MTFLIEFRKSFNLIFYDHSFLLIHLLKKNFSIEMINITILFGQISFHTREYLTRSDPISVINFGPFKFLVLHINFRLHIMPIRQFRNYSHLIYFAEQTYRRLSINSLDFFKFGIYLLFISCSLILSSNNQNNNFFI